MRTPYFKLTYIANKIKEIEEFFETKAYSLEPYEEISLGLKLLELKLKYNNEIRKAQKYYDKEKKN